MFWFPPAGPGWGWFVMGLGTLVFWALLIAVGVLLFRTLNRGAGQSPAHGDTERPSPQRLLAERFARGVIDEDEYQRPLSVLEQGFRRSGR
ncbi:SHOCT domain-containing protein [Streptomyces spiralis]